MVKTAKLRLDNMPMSRGRIAIEDILNYEDKRLLESDDASNQDYKLNEKKYINKKNEITSH